MTGRRLCTVLLGGHEFGLPVSAVEEVVRGQEVTPVPLAARAVRGLVHSRGRIVPVMDLRRCIDLPGRTAGTPPMHVMLRTADGPVALEVDRILDVVETDGAREDRPPETLPASVRDLIAATCLLQDRVVLVLDLDHLLALTEGERAVTAAAP